VVKKYHVQQRSTVNSRRRLAILKMVVINVSSLESVRYIKCLKSPRNMSTVCYGCCQNR